MQNSLFLNMLYICQVDHPLLEEEHLFLTRSSGSVVLETVERKHRAGAQGRLQLTREQTGWTEQRAPAAVTSEHLICDAS